MKISDKQQFYKVVKIRKNKITINLISGCQGERPQVNISKETYANELGRPMCESFTLN